MSSSGPPLFSPGNDDSPEAHSGPNTASQAPNLDAAPRRPATAPTAQTPIQDETVLSAPSRVDAAPNTETPTLASAAVASASAAVHAPAEPRRRSGWPPPAPAVSAEPTQPGLAASYPNSPWSRGLVVLTTIANVHWFYWAAVLLVASLFSRSVPIQVFKNLGTIGIGIALALFVAITLSTIGNVTANRHLAMVGQYVFLALVVLFVLVLRTVVGLPLLLGLGLHGFLLWWTSTQTADEL